MTEKNVEVQHCQNCCQYFWRM